MTALETSQEEFNRRVDCIPAFRGRPSPTCLIDLAAAGITLDSDDVNLLLAGLEKYGAEKSLRLMLPGETQAEIEREQKIASLADKLMELLDVCESDKGRRFAQWNDNILDFEETVDLEDLSGGLKVLAESARERLDWLKLSKRWGIGPKSGRSDPPIFIYWTTLLAFWEYWLWRNPRPSDGSSPGPVVDFMRIMNADAPPHPRAVRSFVDRARSKGRLKDFAFRFLPRHAVALKDT